MKQLTTLHVLTGSFVLLALIPPFVFLGAALVGGMDVASSLSALGEQYVADRVSLFMVTILGMFPLVLVAALLGIRRLVRKTWDGSLIYAWAGIIPVLLVSVFSNLEYWPRFLPNRQFLGFPHGLEFTIGPLIFAPIGMVFTFLIVFAIRRQS